MFDHKLEPKPSVARRVEVFTGTGRRRRWSSDEKARILEETLAVGAVVSEVARRHGITSQQLFGWRRSASKRDVTAACRRIWIGLGVHLNPRWTPDGGV